MRILAIDPGFGRIGIAVLEKKEGQETVLYSSCIQTKEKDLFNERLMTIRDAIKKIIETYSPTALAIETLFFNTNQKTAMRVAEARGAIILTASIAGLSVAEYTPLQIKTAVTGYGHAEKAQVEAMVYKLVQLDNEKKLDDEIDAIAIGLTHLAHRSGAS